MVTEYPDVTDWGRNPPHPSARTTCSWPVSPRGRSSSTTEPTTTVTPLGTTAGRMPPATCTDTTRATGVLTLIVLAVIAWWAFGQPTLEDMQTKSIGELMQGWRF